MDYGSKDGAHNLARQIRSAWAKAGFDIETEVVPVVRAPVAGEARSLFAVLTPGLVNGLPVAGTRVIAA